MRVESVSWMSSLASILSNMCRIFNKRTWLQDRFVAITARERQDLPAQLSLKQFLAEPQVHLPAVSSGADLIGHWRRPITCHAPWRPWCRVMRSAGEWWRHRGYLMCPLPGCPRAGQHVAVAHSGLPDGAPDLTLTILSLSLYDHQPDIVG